MTMNSFILLGLFLGSALGQECENNQESFGAFCYQWSILADGVHNFWEARQQCLNAGGDLASVGTIEEYNFLAETHYVEAHWLGGTAERAQNGTYHWLDGTPWNASVAQAAWGDGQPSGGNQHCTAWWQSEIGKWDDKNCDTYYAGYLCKFPKRDACTCADNESRFCDRDYTCTSYRACESGQTITVSCPPGRKLDADNNCVDPVTLGPPCNWNPNCTGVANGNYPSDLDYCRTYYTCAGGSLTAMATCPDQERGEEQTFDPSVGYCRPAVEVCAPCGRPEERPPTDPPCQA
ncbi:unnamed protein product [Owenia fusiformis]|uniref:Uncharacterized protein n=1 Tax=Owenia fusiformis TaxID=6347 RepID=A0A8J1TY53_OWEFU|nr:unnamed protein product [Owenia fusiformis]